VFDSRSRKFSSVYLFSLGYVKDLKNSMELKDMSDNDIVCKYGRTNDLSRRAGEHILNYNKINGVTLKLMLYSFIDDEYGVEAESSIKSFFSFAGSKFQYEKEDELVIIQSNKMKEVKIRYEALENEYSKGIEIFKKEILKKENELLQVQNEMIIMKLTNEKELMKRDKDNELMQKDNELMQKDNELMQKDNELMQVKLNNVTEICELKLQVKQMELNKLKQK
jgi:hypothetical protein